MKLSFLSLVACTAAAFAVLSSAPTVTAKTWSSSSFSSSSSSQVNDNPPVEHSLNAQQENDGPLRVVEAGRVGDRAWIKRYNQRPYAERFDDDRSLRRMLQEDDDDEPFAMIDAPYGFEDRPKRHASRFDRAFHKRHHHGRFERAREMERFRREMDGEGDDVY